MRPRILGPVLLVVLALYATMSALAVVLYAADKRRAVRHQWRISEAALHAVEMLGGWPGALMAQRVVRHKLHKPGYMLVFWLIVAAHLTAWAWWAGAFP
jgi:uncharacterized membrane protein YsdA (DUF1294 family)